MAHKGQLYRNLLTGETTEFIETSADTGGSHITIKACLRQGGGFKVNHCHPYADEIFQVISGTLNYKLNGTEKKAGPGEKIILPSGQPHAHWNAGPEELVILQTITPCLDIERFLETLFGLAMDGRLNKDGQPRFLQVMVWLRAVQNKTYLADIPVSIQKLLSFLLAPLAKMLGYKAFYSKYSTQINMRKG
jgi:quercetin dioxygenase-like cupin family protein